MKFIFQMFFCFFFFFFVFFVLLKTISSMNCQDVKHEMSKPLSGNISKCHLLDVDKTQIKICSRRLPFGLDFNSKKILTFHVNSSSWQKISHECQ